VNIEFAYPWALALLPVIPVILWLIHRQPKPTIAWPGAAELTDLADRHSTSFKNGLISAALLTGILALAGPRWPLPGDPLDDAGVAIMLVVDVSGSMAEPDFEWNDQKLTRLEAVKRALTEFIQRRPQDRIGLVLFAKVPETACPLTRDHEAVTKTLQATQPRGIPTESETNLGDAVAWGLVRLQSEAGRKLIVVLSDGEHNVGAPALTPRQSGQLAAAATIPVYTIFTAPPTGEGRTGLESLSSMTGGQSFAAADANALTRAQDDVDRLARQTSPDFRRRRYTESYPWLALSACGLFLGWFVYDRGPGLTLPC